MGKLFPMFHVSFRADIGTMDALSTFSPDLSGPDDIRCGIYRLAVRLQVVAQSNISSGPRESMTVVRSEYSESAQQLPSSSPAELSVPELVFGRSSAMQDVRRRLQSVANTDLPVLLQGESGTGKSLCAQFIHRSSARSRNAFIKVNCPAIPNSLLDTEMFGYDKGASINAKPAQLGRVEQAHLGTLVLDEVGGLDNLAQSKLLQVLQDKAFTHAGGHELHAISTRVISIANTNLRKRVQEGWFRADLLYRINSVTITLPPLRERLDDLPELIGSFSERHAFAFGIQRQPFSKYLLQLMCEYSWPGNLRELDNLIRGYILLGDEEAIVSELSLPQGDGNHAQTYVDTKKPFSLKRITKTATQELERHIILKVLQANGWNRQRTAKWLQISYRSLLYKLNEAGSSHHMRRNDTVKRKPEPSSHRPLHTTPDIYPFQVQ